MVKDACCPASAAGASRASARSTHWRAGLIMVEKLPRTPGLRPGSVKETSAQVIVALGVGAEGALHARAPRRRKSEARSWLGQAHVPVACFGVPSRVGAPSPDPQGHAPGCAEFPNRGATGTTVAAGLRPTQ